MSGHHAYLYQKEADLPESIDYHAIDTVVVRAAQLTIDEARSLQQLATLKTFKTGETRTIVIITDRIRHEAQNALLKLLEEPPSNTVFHIVVSDQHSLLPTLQSRFLPVEATNHTRGGVEVFQAFLSSSYCERLEAVTKATGQKDSAWAKAIVEGLGEKIAASPQLNGELYEVYSLVCAHLDGPGASNKMLLEYLALTLKVE